ncbi:MAG: sigma-70 family RNA polymerase sigma factor [Deltaproteobacteria bacterium]|nr:sigma-70 family RNA polymerase sigma factor [Deltaproteobacteria bacterium]
MIDLRRHSDRTRAEFEGLLEGQLDALYAAAMRLTRNARDAEDLVQDAVLRAYRFFDRFERGTHFRAWIFRILTNTFINRYRRSVKERTLVDGPERESVTEQLVSRDAADQAGDPERHFFGRLVSDDVVRAVDALPIDFRMVVILADLQEFSYKEIADILDIPVGTVMSRLFRGRRLLEKSLLDYAAETGHVPTREDGSIDLQSFRSRKSR